MFDTVAIVGLGLLGGSLGMALRSRKLARRVVALVRREATLDEGHRMGALDEGSLEPAVVAGAELIVLAPPVQQIAPLARNIAPFLDAGALVTDVGSTKAALAREIPTLLPAGREFLGGHPMAGSELTGVLHAREDLFEHTVYLLTPTATTRPESLARLRELACRLGACPLELGPEVHDAAVARISHLPHVAAAALATAAGVGGDAALLSRIAAGGFRDTTRIAGGSPEMWRDICVTNREAVLTALGVYEGTLGAFRTALEQGDGSRLLELFQEGRQARADLAAATGEGKR